MNTKTLSFIDYVLTAALALAFTAAPYYMNSEGSNCDFTFGYVLSLLVIFIIFLILTYLFRNFLDKYDWNRKNTFKAATGLEQILSRRNAALIIAILICAAWIIPLCFLYPGTFINDTWGELQQFIRYSNGEAAFSDHHPIFDTLVISLIIVPLSQLTGKWHIIIFIYVLIQAILTSLAFASTVTYTYKKLGLGAKVSGALLLLYCIIPIFPAAVQTVSKDALHSWGFVFFVILYIELVRTNGLVIKDKSFLAKLCIVTAYCCLTKKVGFYVMLFSLIAAFLFQKNNRIYLVIPIAAAIILMNGVMPIIMTNLQVSPGGKQEMFSLPFQMTARYVKYYSNDITEEEYKILDKVLSMDTLADRYNATNADPVKNYHQKE